MASPCLGDWVDFQSFDSAQQMTGFIVDRVEGRKLCKVCVPASNKTYMVRYCDLTPSPAGLRFGDTQALIDLSLETRDEAWFVELVKWEPRVPVKPHVKFLWIFVPLVSLLVLLI